MHVLGLPYCQRLILIAMQYSMSNGSAGFTDIKAAADLQISLNSLTTHQVLTMNVTVFGYLILISMDFYDFISQFAQTLFLVFSFKHSRQCLTSVPNTSKVVKSTPLRVEF